jgi:hypothetical protein
MDWKEASAHLQRMYKEIEGPHVLPGYMFDFWSLLYLMGKGFTIEQIKKFTAVAQELLVKGFGDAAPASAPYEDRLVHFQPLEIGFPA